MKLRKKAERYKLNYDVREATLSIGDKVLIRQVELKGKHKLADKWARDPYIVVGIPNSNIPVYKVQKERGDSPVKTLHRNMLLPFTAIPIIKKVTASPETKSKPSKVIPSASVVFFQILRNLTLITEKQRSLFLGILFRREEILVDFLHGIHLLIQLQLQFQVLPSVITNHLSDPT